MVSPTNDVALRLNLSANGFPEVPEVVLIPVIIPANPSTVVMVLISSFENVGRGART